MSAGSANADGNGKSHDLLILGGGSAAFAAAIRASSLGARVGMINAGPLGGTCVNIGCVPSKTLIRAAENHHWNGLARFAGVTTSPGSVDWEVLVREKDELVEDLKKAKYVDILAGLSTVDLIEGRGSLKSANEVEVNGSTLRGEKILIATGARPATPPIPGLVESGAWDSTQALSAPFLPGRVIVLGGRYIALELGEMFQRLGTRVTLVQRSDRILPDQDPDVGKGLTTFLENEGMVVLAGTRILRVGREGSGFLVEIEQDGETRILRADAVVYALGRRPNTDSMGLAGPGIGLGGEGELLVNEYLETSLPGIYGAGDVIGKPAFVYSAAYEGSLAADNALNRSPSARDYTAIPWVIFTDPQVAGVGLDETEAEHQGIEVDVSVLPLSAVPRAVAARDTRGFIKLLRPRGEDRLVGARIVAPEGGEQIMEASLMIKYGLPVSEVARDFHPYLTQSEGIKLALQTFDKDVKQLSCCAH